MGKMNTCKGCKEQVTNGCHVYIRGEYYHDKCYIAYLVDVLQIIYTSTQTIIKQTQGNNASANSEARSILRKLEEI